MEGCLLRWNLGMNKSIQERECMEELQEEQTTLTKEPKEVNMLGKYRSHLYSSVQDRRRGFLEDKDGNVRENHQVVPFEMANIPPFLNYKMKILFSST